MFSFSKFLVKYCLLICIYSSAYSSDQNDIIPSQNEQIKVYSNWSCNQSLENYEELKKISKKNFNIIEKTILDRFGSQSERYNLFTTFKTSALNTFDQGRMNLNFLTDNYSLFVMLLDSECELNESFVKFMKINREKVYKFFTPFPIVSQDGISDLDTIYKLPITGKWYIGIPLMKNPVFDGQISTSTKFFVHDLFHGDFLGDPAVKEVAFNFLQKFEDTLSSTCQNNQDKEILDVILFNIIHEAGATFEHEKGQGLFNLFSLSEVPTLKEEGKILLNAGEINMKSPNFLDIHEGFADYFIQKGIMRTPRYEHGDGENISLDQIAYINRQSKMKQYVEITHQMIQFYKSKFD